jgi:DNA-binding transcriptional MerR regulator
MDGPLSIGKLAKATGFSVGRLRMWEQRYGAPKGVRLQSGHRRYARKDIQGIQLVKYCLERGFRPGHLLGLEQAQLIQLLDKAETEALPGWEPAPWVALVQAMDRVALQKEFQQHWKALGPMRFMQERADPFIQALGNGWEKGRLCIAEEHFATEVLEDHFSGAGADMDQTAQGPRVAVTTLAGDRHRLGLQMVSVACTLAGLRPLNLGPDLPRGETSALAKRLAIRGVFLSIAAGYDLGEAQRQLAELRKELGPGTALAVGGAGAPAPESESDWIRFHSLESFRLWAQAWNASLEPRSERGTRG